MSIVDVHTYRAAEGGLSVNSYLLETEDAVVVIDSNLLNSDIRALRARIDALRKPLAAIFVTHAHPDHFNGVLELVRDREVPVYATRAVDAKIREIADAKRAQWTPTFGAEWPTETVYPNSPVADGAQLQVAGLAISVHDLGSNESHADSLLRISSPGQTPRSFVGDLVFNGLHPYTADGHTAAWLRALDRLHVEVGDNEALYPGHGAPVGKAALDDQRRYLLFYREIVQRLADGKPRLTEGAKAELESAMTTFLPGARLVWMIGLGADAVAAELAAEHTPSES
jgi:glyoxylase-like metal-dependent hydrolase (beta-lactamase superfamily II)